MPRPYRPLAVERLEDRTVPTVYSWGAVAAGAPGPPQGFTGYWLSTDPFAWDNPYNWANGSSGKNNDGVPGPADTVVFDGSLTFAYYDQSGGHTVTLGARQFNDSNHPNQTHVVNVIEVGPTYNSSISIPALTFTGGGLIQSGHFGGNFVNGGDLTIQTAGTVELAGTLTNNGVVHHAGGTLALGDNSSPATGVIVNPLGSTYEITGGAAVLSGYFFQPHVQNGGTIRKVEAGTATVQNVVSDKTASIAVEAGTLDVQAASDSGLNVIDGTPLTVAAGATLQLDSQFSPVQWTGDIRVTGTGTVAVSSANSGAFLWNAAVSAPAANLVVNGATVQGTGSIAAGTTLTVPKGTFNGTFTNNGTVALTGLTLDANNPDDVIYDAHFVNAGRLVVSTPVLRVTHDQYTGVTLDNLPGATIEVAEDTQIVGGGAAGTAINNAGTFLVDAGVKAVGIRSVFNTLGGTIDIRSGSVTVPNDTNSTSTGGTFRVAAGASLDFRVPNDSGYYSGGGHYSGKYTGSGGGAVLFGAGTNFDAPVFDFPDGMLSIAPDAGQTANYVAGGFTNDGFLTFANPAGTPLTVGLGNGYDFFNRGTVRFAPNELINLSSQYGNSNWTNLPGGLIEFGVADTLSSSYAGNPYAPGYSLVLNRGTLRFLGLGEVRATLDNQAGTVQADGAVTLDSVRLSSRATSGVVTGGWVARGGGSITIPVGDLGGVAQFAGTAVVDGAGSDLPFLRGVADNSGSLSALNGATFSVTGDLVNTGQLTVAGGGTLAVGGTLTLAAGGTLTTLVGGPPAGGNFGRVTAGTSATLGGTLAAGLDDGYAPADADRFAVVTAPAVTGSFSARHLNGLVAQLTPAAVFLSSASAAADLAVGDVQLVAPPGGVVSPGAAVAVRFTVTNRSSRAAAGGWSDAVYLSESGALDATATLVARLAETAGLAGFASETLTVPLTGPARPGVFTVLVAADSRDAVPDLDRANNAAAAPTPLTVAAPDLPPATDVTAAFPAGDVTYYKLTVPAGSGPLRVTATFNASDAGTLAVAFAVPPTGAAGDTVRPAQVGGAGRVAAVELPAGQAGFFYIAVARRTGRPVVLRADSAGLTITGLGGEAQLNPQVPAGGSLTLTVRGGGFTPATVFALGRLTWDGTQVAATRAEVLDSGTAVVTFRVPAAGGPYYVGAADGAAPAVYAGKAFTAVAAPAQAVSADWTVQVSMPRTLRTLQPFHATVTFRNDSAAGQPAPLLELAADNSVIRLASQATFAGSSLLVLGVKASGRPDDYAPGEVGTLDVVLQQDPATFGPHVSLNLYATTVDEQAFAPAPGPPGSGAFGPRPLPADFLDGLHPAVVPDDAWAGTVRANMAAEIGTTYASYADALRTAAVRVAAGGGDARDVARLNGYLLALADEFDAVSARYALSALGRGVANPYDVRATADPAGNVLVRVGNAFRPFFAAAAGTFQAAPGDTGTLISVAGGGYRLSERNGATTRFGPDGRMTSTTDAHGRTITAAYAAGRLLSLTCPNGDATTFATNAAGRITTITDPVGRVTTYGYDATGERLTSVTTPAGVTSITWNPDAAGPKAYTVAAVTGPGGVPSRTEYDAFGRLARTSVGNNRRAVSYSYGSGTGLGTVTATDALGRATTAVLGEGGVPLSVSGPAGVTAFAADPLGNLTGVTSAGAGPTTLSVDATGNTTAVTDPAGGRTRIGYDDAGRPIAIRDALGHATGFAYDAAGYLSSQTAPDGGVTRTAHDALGDPTFTESSAVRSVRSTYDSKGLLARRDYADGSHTTYAYDAHRNLTAVTESVGNAGATLTYDAADRLTRVAYSSGQFVAYHYDAAGREDEVTTSAGTTTAYGYDDLGRLATASRGGVAQVTYAYDDLGRPASTTYADGTADATTYDAAGRVARIDHRAPGGAVVDFQAYTHDATGNVATQTTPAGTTTYGYDLLGQLTRVAPPTGPAFTYAYDAAGNRIGGAVNVLNQATAAADGTAYQYDADGNRVVVSPPGAAGQPPTVSTYDARNRLTAQTGPAGSFAYTYDALGQRASVTRNGVRTDLVIDPLAGGGLGGVAAESVGGTVSATYLTAAGVAGRYDAAGAGSYYHFDAQGNTTSLTAGGAVTAAYTYRPFGDGATATGTGASINPSRFDGRDGAQDRGTGLIDLHARFYDPAAGRFTQPDPTGLLGRDANLYRYAGNSPLSFVDPSGRFPAALFTPGFGALTLPLRVAAGLGGTGLGTALGGFTGATVVVDAGLVTGVGIATATIDASIGLGSALPTVATFSAPLTISNTVGVGYTTTSANIAGLSTGPASVAGAVLTDVLAPVAITAAGAYVISHELITIADPQGVTYATAEPLVTRPYLDRLNNTARQDPYILKLIQDYQRLNNGKYPPPTTIIQWMRDKRDYDQTRPRPLPHGGAENVTAHDPNEIVGPSGYGPQGFLIPVGPFGYTIRFENTPDATAPARVVRVTQTLDADLDWSTFRLTSFGFRGRTFDVPAGLTSYHARIADPDRNGLVDVKADFDAATGVLSWTFTTLDPATLDTPADPLVGFLPPDADGVVGQGFVGYSVDPKANAATGTTYTARASVVFDTNAAIATASIVNTADAGRPAAAVAALPAQTPGTGVTVTWSGADDSGGSGLTGFDIFVCVDGAAFAPWLRGTALTTAVYPGEVGKTYAFYAAAADNVGLTQRPAFDV